MKKLIRLILIIIVIILIVFGIMKFNNYRDVEETLSKSIVEEKEEEEIPIQWHGQYIWNEDTVNDSWTCFRKKINIENDDFGKVIAQISVDSKYWLYINDEMIIREGGEKRGQKINSIYYDNVDLTKYLKKGENTIAILAWYWGDSSYSYNPSGRAAMLFQAKIGDEYIISDETWKVSHANGFERDKKIPNYRLAEYNIYYDADKADENWYKSDYNDENWLNAIYQGNAGDSPWGEMIERDIPQFKNWDIKEYQNMSDYKDYTTAKNETLEMKIGYNAQLTPYLKIEATKGDKITIKTDQYEDINGDSLMCTYITKDGVQEFESPGWINGEKVYYQIPKNVKIISLGYRETGYDTEMTGKFQCNDEFFNKLWKMANRTLYVNMRDTYMDCPNRERAQWWGDVSIDMMEAMYALDTNSYSLYEKGLKTLEGWTIDGVIQTVTPVSNDTMFLPIQMLSGVNSVYEYYQYTGKKEPVEEVYPYLKEFLELWEFNEIEGRYNLKPVNTPVWEWGDSAGGVDYDLEENMWYFYAIKRMTQLSQALEYSEDYNYYNEKTEHFRTYLNNLWTERGYKSPDFTGVDERVNAVAVLSGLADETKYEIITNIFKEEYQTSSCMEKYVLEALCKMRKVDEAQKRIKDRYNEMVNSDKACSTLWENWDYIISSKNHAWSGGPLIIMSKYFAGIEPLEKGYDVISIKPQFGQLTKIKSNVTTIKGDIEFDAKREDDNLYMKINVPSKTRIAIPKINFEIYSISINDKKVYENGKIKKDKIATFDSEDDSYIYFYVEAGNFEIKCK